jgi:hypothetical protein
MTTLRFRPAAPWAQAGTDWSTTAPIANVAISANVRRSIVVFGTKLPSRITNTREAAIGTSPFGPPKAMLTGDRGTEIMPAGDPSGKKICTPVASKEYRSIEDANADHKIKE